jgi:hypothetical protein
VRPTSWTTELVEGEPITVGQREWIPVVQVHSILRRRVTFGTTSSSGSGGGLIWLQPTAVIERLPGGSERRIAVPDQTGMVITGMLIGALALPILCLFVVGFMFLWRTSRRRLRPEASS